MSKVNPAVKAAPMPRLAGGYGVRAARQNADALLRRSVMACLLWGDLAYESGAKNTETIASLIPQVSPDKVAQIALEARRDQKLRHVPLYMVVEMAKLPEYRLVIEGLLPKIITRADQLTDFLALYWKEGRKPLAHAIKRGLAEAVLNFDEYQLAKYDRDGGVKLRDVLRMVHPKPRNAHQAELLGRVKNRTLKTPDTWEVALSSGADKRASWERLINEGKLGPLAFLRNLRNMKQAFVDANVIRKGLRSLNAQSVLPLNFWAAVREAPEFASDIDALMIRSYNSLPKLPGKTIFVIDISGSMEQPISGKSAFARTDAASAMAVLASMQCEEVEIWATAGNDSSRIHATAKIDYPEQGFGLARQIINMRRIVGSGGIFTRQCLEYIKSRTNFTQADRIIVFSDSQDCDRDTTKKPNPFGVRNYIVDVSAHKHGIAYEGVWTAEISGWSEHFLTFIGALEGIQNVFDDN